MSILKEIRDFLEQHREEDYQNFQAKLLPTLPKEQILGVRVSVLRNFVKYLMRERKGEMQSFLRSLPHASLEENHIHVLYLSMLEDVELVLAETKIFLPFLNNWANCDAFVPKAFRQNPSRVYEFIQSCLNSSQAYTKRFALVQLLSYCLDNFFEEEILENLVALSWKGRDKKVEGQNENYYVQMALAWYFATALAKQWDSLISYFETECLAPWTHNKAIQKAIESLRISQEKKEYLKSLRRK